MIGTQWSKPQSWVKVLLSFLFAPLLAHATDDHIRLDKSLVTINIDWQGNVTGNDPINVFISRNNGGAGCTRVSNAVILVERPPLSCSGEFNPTNSCYGGGLHEPIAEGGVWTQAHTPTQLCNVNESDVWLYQQGNTTVPQPAHFYPFPNIDSNPDIEMSLAHYPLISAQGDGKTLLDPKAFCDQMGRPGSWSHDYVVRVMWDPHWGGTGFFQGLVNAINEVPTQSGFDFSWTNDSNSGKADTQFTATINCLAPPTPTLTYTLMPNSVYLTVDSNYQVWGGGQTISSVLYYRNPACAKTMSAGAVFSKQVLNVSGSAPVHATPVLIGKAAAIPDATSPSSCSSQTIVMGNTVLPAEVVQLCKDPSNSGKTLARGQTMLAQLCASGDCSTYGTADMSAQTSLAVNVICPIVITDPVSNKGPVGIGKPIVVGGAAGTPASQAAAGASVAPAATDTPAAPVEKAPKPADEIEIPAAKPTP
jgi:hypothetical protein